jgi:ribonuclease BN (tRNA processing enzyme)
MKIVFLGVGEAFDEAQPNNSSLVTTDETKLMLDCGFTVPGQLWRYNADPNFLDGVNISHQHADHFFGLPALLLRMWEGGRTRSFTIICQKDLKDSFDQFMELAYKGFKAKFGYQIELVESQDGGAVEFGDLKLFFERTVHSGDNLAVKVSDGQKTFAYSGDGSPLSDTGFYKDVDLLVLETYLYDEERIGHSSMMSAIEFAKVNNAKALALTHINRDLRRTMLAEIRAKLPDGVFVPEPLQEAEL